MTHMFAPLILFALSLSGLLQCFAEICGLADFTIGKWEYTPNKTEKDFFCCDKITTEISEENKLRCKEIGYTSGFCGCDARENTVFTVNEREKWFWRPDNCEVLDYSPSSLCRLIGNRTITILGDSIAGETTGAIKAFLYNTDCSRSIKSISFNLATKSLKALGIVGGLRSTLQTHKGKIPDVLILNFGAWYHNMSDFESAMLDVENDILYLRKQDKYKHVQFVWRTNMAAHENCLKFHKPLQEDHSPINFSLVGETTFPGHDTLPNTWHLFPLFDEYAKIRMKHIHVPWFDIFTPLSMRPDMHGNAPNDCLHACLPGPLDHIFNRLLMHYLYYSERYAYIEQ